MVQHRRKKLIRVEGSVEKTLVCCLGTMHGTMVGSRICACVLDDAYVLDDAELHLDGALDGASLDTLNDALDIDCA